MIIENRVLNWLWKIYATLAIITLLIDLIGSIDASFVFHSMGMSGHKIAKLFWLDNAFYYSGLLLIGVTAFYRKTISLWIGILLLFYVATIFYRVFIWSDGSLSGFGAWLVNSSAITSVLMEICCLTIIFLSLKNKLNHT